MAARQRTQRLGQCRRRGKADLYPLAAPVQHQCQCQSGADGVGIGVDVADYPDPGSGRQQRSGTDGVHAGPRATPPVDQLTPWVDRRHRCLPRK